MKKKIILGLLCASALFVSEQNKTRSSQYQEYFDRQTCKEVCGVSFGSSYESAKEILKAKYGEPDYLDTDENKIVYSYKSYGGIQFSHMAFVFQRDNYNSYMSQCAMGIDCKTIQDAKNNRDYIYSKVKERYGAWHVGIDGNGFKYYQGGTSPLGEFGEGFIIDVVKYDDSKSEYKYIARIMYGPYNYVKEEF